MAYTLSIEDVLVYAVCSRRYILDQSLLFVESNGLRGLPCIVQAKIGGQITFIDGEKVITGGKNIYAYDPKHINAWLQKRKFYYNQAKKNLHKSELIVSEFQKEMEDIANGSGT